jgi:DNA topoisomerase-2
VEIKELPIGTWTKNYKEFLEKMLEDGSDLIEFKEFHTNNRVHFWLKFN